MNKLTEIMIVREDGLKLFQVDDSTLARLTRIRGNLYQDNPRLRTVADMPTMTQSQIPEVSPEMQARAEAAYRAYMASRAATAATPSPVTQPKPMTFEEKLEHDWKYSPAIRAEFVSLASYEAYCRAVRDGRAKVYGHG